MGQHAGDGRRPPIDPIGRRRDRRNAGGADGCGAHVRGVLPPHATPVAREHAPGVAQSLVFSGDSSEKTEKTEKTEDASRSRRDLLGDHLRRLADAVTALPGPDRPEALTDAEVEYVAAAVRNLDVETSAMIVARLRGLRARVPSAREADDDSQTSTPNVI